MNLPRPARGLGHVGRLGSAPIARSLGKLWSAQGVVLVAGTVQALLAARWLGPANFGAVGLVLVTPLFLYSFLDPQSGHAVVRYLAEALERGDAGAAAAAVRVGFGADLLLAGVGAAATIAAAPWAADHVVKVEGVTSLIVVAALGTAASAPAMTARSVLSALSQFTSAAVLTASLALVKTFLVLGAAAVGSIRTVVYATVAGLVVECGATVVVASRRLRQRTSMRWWRARRSDLPPGDFRAMVRFLVYTDLSSLAGSLVKQVDLLVLGYFGRPADAGVYRLARSMTTPLVSVSEPLQSVVYPELAAIRAHAGVGAARDAAMRRMRRVGLPVAAVVLVGAAAAGPLIALLAGNEYRGAAWPTSLLLAGGGFSLAFFWVRPLFLVLDEVRALLVISSVFAAVTAMAFVLAAPGGPTAVAAARAIVAGLLGNLVFSVYVRRSSARAGVRREDEVVR